MTLKNEHPEYHGTRSTSKARVALGCVQCLGVVVLWLASSRLLGSVGDYAGGLARTENDVATRNQLLALDCLTGLASAWAAPAFVRWAMQYAALVRPTPRAARIMTLLVDATAVVYTAVYLYLAYRHSILDALWRVLR